MPARLSITTVVAVSSNDVRTTVEGERDAARRRVADLEGSFDAIAASVDSANTDDEHDPEGATLGFERAQVVSMLEDARAELDALDDAASRIEAGTYGVCERCGRDIGSERLAARPSARLCVDCATHRARGTRSR
jgi:RNA polymerase-binding protein DksA